MAHAALPKVLLRRPVWPSPPDVDVAQGLTPAVATATSLLDQAEADLSQAEDAVLAQGGVGRPGTVQSVERLDLASQRFRLARMRVLILRELVGRGLSDV